MVVTQPAIEAQRLILQRILTKYCSQIAAGFIISNGGVDLLAIGFHTSGHGVVDRAGVETLLGRGKNAITLGFKPVRTAHVFPEVTAVVDTGAEFQRG